MGGRSGCGCPLPLSPFRHHLSDPLHPFHHRRLLRPEREPDVVPEAGWPAAAAFAGVHVEELAWDADDLAFECVLEEAHAGVEGGWEGRHVAPPVEGPFGVQVEPDPRGTEPTAQDGTFPEEDL